MKLFFRYSLPARRPSLSFLMAGGFLILYSLFFFSSCEKVDKPYKKWTPPVPSANDTIRKILIEDFTGHKCPNCPRAALTIRTLDALYPGQIIAVAIHPTAGGGLTSPTPPTYPNDYRTTIGDSYFNTFSEPSLGLPQGTINRKKTPGGQYGIADGDWTDSVNAMVHIAPDVLLKITNTYNTTSRQLTASVKCSYLNTLSGSYKLIMLLTEDSIIAAQTNGTSASNPADPSYPAPEALYYKHMHILRDCISDGAGTGLATGAFTQGTSETISAPTYTLPANFKGMIPNEQQCKVIAFIYNTATNEIIQAEEAKLIP